jgi:broad specificity phosphatase PhoE
MLFLFGFMFAILYSMTTYYFIRHGESTANQALTAAGWSDVPLTDLGRNQALAAGQSVLDSGLVFDCIVSSPLQRAYDTALAIASVVQYPDSSILVVDDLKERGLGRLELEPLQAVFDTPEENFAQLGAESIMAFQQRVRSAVSQIHQLTSHHQTVLIVAHAGIYKIGMTIVRDQEPTGMYKMARVENATLMEFPI